MAKTSWAGLELSREFVLPLSIFQVSGRVGCVEWRVVGQPGQSATGAQRPAPQPVPLNPTRRAPRRPASKQARSASAPSPGPTPAATVDPGNAEAIAQIMAALVGMGIPELLLQQVRSSIPPAPAGKAWNNSLQKLTKHLRRLEEEFLETRTKYEEKTVELENASTEYRLLRDTGKFTPAFFASPAASLNGDDDDINAHGDTVDTMEGVGSGEARGSNDPIPSGVGAGDMDVGGAAPTQTRAAG